MELSLPSRDKVMQRRPPDLQIMGYRAIQSYMFPSISLCIGVSGERHMACDSLERGHTTCMFRKTDDLLSLKSDRRQRPREISVRGINRA